jgi:hypothetical protein
MQNILSQFPFCFEDSNPFVLSSLYVKGELQVPIEEVKAKSGCRKSELPMK